VNTTLKHGLPCFQLIGAQGTPPVWDLGAHGGARYATVEPSAGV